ncbi:MAG: phosphodiester glycosidase family protein [Planctomycetes bacterium]|nr:phosphodiester glycosidase family protein [Planctomycetota bacterium]
MTSLALALLAALAAPETKAPVFLADRAIGPRTARIEPWRPIFRGIEYATAEATSPRPLRVHAVRIDLREPGIEFLATPSNGEHPLDVDGMKTSTFLEKYGCQLAINASPYAPLAVLEGVPQDVHGLSVSRGDAYSPPNDTYGALLIAKDNRAWIAAAPIDPKGAYNAVGGFRLLLRAGENVASDDALHPRTAAGVSEDGRRLILIVIDGRQRGYSEGTTTAETAEWIRRFGARDAVNLDGGGSSALVIADAIDGARILNRPIHAGIPGNERVNANHLGVFARPLEAPPVTSP